MNRKERRQASANARAKPLSAVDPVLARDFRDAVQYLQAGKLHESDLAHRRVLAKSPRHAPSLHHLGLIAFKLNARPDAVDYIRQSLTIDPRNHQAWLNLAVILGEMRHADEAIDACRRCMALQPTSSEAFAVLANLLRIAQNNVDAAAAYSDSLRLKPAQPDILTRLGELMLQSGDAAEALVHCRRALEINPSHEAAGTLERRILASTESLDTAQALLEAQAKTPAELAQSLDQLGAFLRAERRHQEAVSVYRKAILLEPNRADWIFNLALALEGSGQKEEAFASYQAGLAIDPDRAEAYANVGCLLRSMNMHTGAIQAFEHALKLDPDLAVAHYNLAVTFKERERFEDARSAFARSVECAPDSIVNRFEFANLRRILCDWDGLDTEDQRCLELFRARTTSVAPFNLISMLSSRSDQLDAARRYAKMFGVPEAAQFKSHHNGSGVDQRIRVGFLSSDFFEHATTMLLVEILENLDRKRFELFGYCFSPDDGSKLRHRIIGAFEHYVHIGAMSDHDAAQTIHSDGIDILIDLKGYTKDARAEILAYRPAPVQVNYLGYPGTMGADFIDYILADAIVAPMEHQEQYSERIVHLPHCYQPNDRQRKIDEEPVTRADFGLPEDAFVFCSFNNSYKINAAMFDVWMRLLQSVPGSVLWLLGSNDICRENLRREAASRGVESDRLVFAGRLPIAKHLARQRLADLFLDALPCNAHTTASDALWVGLPVLTCMGETFSGRVAASLLTAMDLPELITHSPEEYAQAALTLALDKGRLEQIRHKLAEQRQTAPLFDSHRYARNLESSFETMVDIMRSAEAPRPFVVVDNESKAPIETVMPLENTRTLYDKCPLCDGADIPHQIEAKVTNHPLYKPQLPPTMKWCACSSCGHVFTEGYFTPEACEIIFAATHGNQKVGNDAENQRKVSAKMVERVARYVPNGDWLDIGVGNGSLLFTAAEWGFGAVGTDLRTENVAKLRNLGFEAYSDDIEDIAAVERFSVVSMADVLEHVPFPKRSLAAVHRMMRPGGALFISMPNMDSIIWRVLDATGTNPYWGELEHYHNFTRARLVQLLETQGFKFAEYNISERYRTCMEVIALKV